ncbi:hypothetical protein GCM10010218_12530 [Streptomyces mashuensis]|uniref:Uncharacterized protein n=1 Tax=Streptomyces mashuensis TaxID=33904 RepID=A0A919AZG2_9ACTN|nr:hypothetical protein [Streptomyces mashuensis]GHF32956.1 hypothetical protein GCM10010218_12530 [Streptomyces mashuensis]
MPVTLAKTLRSFTVLMQDGTVRAVLLTPATQEDRDLLYFDAYWGDCLDLREVTAIDGFDAHTKAVAIHDRETAIEDYTYRLGVEYGAACAVYRSLRTWADAMGTEGRARWIGHPILARLPLTAFVLTEVMREHHELTTA